jgi:hypothetical protein
MNVLLADQMFFDRDVKHCARTTKHVLPISETSSLAETMNVLLSDQMFFDRDVRMPGRSDVSLAATTTCRM